MVTCEVKITYWNFDYRNEMDTHRSGPSVGYMKDVTHCSTIGGRVLGDEDQHASTF